jgi:hypothetical protein
MMATVIVQTLEPITTTIQFSSYEITGWFLFTKDFGNGFDDIENFFFYGLL